MRWPALAIWSVSGGQKVSHAHPVVGSVTRGVFRPDHACWHVVSADTKLVLQRARSCTERGSPCQVWFWAAYMATTQTPGMSALQCQRQLGIKRYETAFLMLHTLRAAMVRPGRDRIGTEWPVEVDETYVGGATHGEGRGRHHKTLVVGMVEVRPRKTALGPDPNLPSGQRPQYRGGHGRSFIAGRLRLQVIPHRKQETLAPLVLANVQKTAEVRTDGWTGYDNLHKLSYKHTAVPVRGDQAKTDQHLPMIHIVFGNLDAWLLGTHHGVSPAHLQGYLNEFVVRFNRRFWPMVGCDSVLKIAARMASPTNRGFYKSAQKRTIPMEPDEPVLNG